MQQVVSSSGILDLTLANSRIKIRQGARRLLESTNPNPRIHRYLQSSTQTTWIGQSRLNRSSPPFKIWQLREVLPTNFAPFPHSPRGLTTMSVTYTLGRNWSESAKAPHRGKPRSTAHGMPCRISKKEKSAKGPSLRKDCLHTCVITTTCKVSCRTSTRRPSQPIRSVPSS